MTAPAWGTPEVPPQPEGLYAVVGFFVARDALNPLYSGRPRAGQRFFEHVEALDPRAAEDKARHEFSGQLEGGITYDLRVCAVLTIADGRIKPVDTYATYLDPDRPALQAGDQ